MNKQQISLVIKDFGHPDPEVRNHAIQKIVGLDDFALFPLAKAIKDENWSVRYSATIALSQLKIEQTTILLIQALKDKEPEVRISAAFALGKAKGENVVAALIQVLGDPIDEVRLVAASALGLIGDKNALPALYKMENTETSLVKDLIEIKSYATEAISRIKQQEN